MYAVIYGTGKWSKLISAKLKDYGVTAFHIGSDPTVCTYYKDWPVSNDCKNVPVFIASSTKDHLADLKLCLALNPSTIFVEKGFSNQDEKEQARKLVGDIPTYILSQYRYSDAINSVINLKEQIVSCRYNWTVESTNISEWVYHILSIDNYLKNTNNQLYIQNTGEYTIDQTSSFSIQTSTERSLDIEIVTENCDIHINLGKTNKVDIKKKLSDEVFNLNYEHEDCLKKQIKDIINSDTTKLERL